MRPRYLFVAGSVATFDRDYWPALAVTTGLSLLTIYPQAALLHDRATAGRAICDSRFHILGSLHPHTNEPSLGSLQSPADKLFAHFWGDYIAIEVLGADTALRLLRDPGGGLPCYYVRTSDGIAATSDVDLLVGAGFLRPSFDRAALRSHLEAPSLRTSHTCLEGVSELLPGHALHCAGSIVVEEQLWSPFRFATEEAEIREPIKAASGLRRVVDATVAAQASGVRKALVAISGGLDSSLVACALSNAGRPFECVTLATREAAGDERAFARPLAEALGVRLHEHFEDTARVDLGRSEADRLPRPVARAFSQSADKLQERIAREIGADAFLHGGGGDNVFCYMPSSRVIADRLVREGILGAWRTSRDMMHLTGASFWDAWRGALRRRWYQDWSFRWPRNHLFLQHGACDGAIPADDHPWLFPPAGCLPGKALHVAWLVGISNYLEGFGRERRFPIMAPLLSQPVVEYCLRIPTWLWCQGGINRSIARLAYSDMLPPIIAERRTKGTPSSIVFRLIEENRTDLRDRLTAGRLAQWGIIKASSVEEALEKAHLSIEECHRISLLNDVEAWIGGWEARISSASPIRQAIRGR